MRHLTLYEVLCDKDAIEAFKHHLEESMSEAELEEYNRLYERIKGTGKIGAMQGMSIMRGVK